MAMPPGGGSSWHHSSDSYLILDDQGAAWAQLNVPLAPASITLTIRSAHSASDWHYLIEIAATDGGAMWTYHHPRLPGGKRSLPWTAETAVERLVPHPDVLLRGQFGNLVEDALPLATVEARTGEIAVVDARGLTRLMIRLGAAPDPAWPAGERGVVARDGQAVACFCLPTGDGALVRKVAVSLP